MYNTITNNDDIQRGVLNFYQGLSYFYSTPSIINSGTVAEDRPLAELEALADNEMNFGKGVRRYDGTWASIDELDTDLFGDDMMRITYDENNRPQLGNYDLVKNLGWLANTDISLKDYIEASDEKTKKVYYDLLDGKTKKIIDQINDIQNNTVDVMDDPLRGRFTLMLDEDGNPYWQEVLVNGSNKQKLEAAGISLVHAYGSKKYSDGAITSGVRSFAKSVADFVPSIMHLAAGVEDLGEALVNGLSGNGFHSDYDALNKSADAVQEWLDESMIGRTSYLADSGVFNSWEGFISGLGQGAGSLVQFGVAGRAIGLGGRLLTRGAKNLSSKIANMNIGKLSESAATVRNTLSANALQTESLGAIAKRINKLIYESPLTVPMYAAGIALNYNEAYQSARDAGLSLEDAATIGVVTGVLNTILENKLGSNVLTRYLVGLKGAQQTAKALVNELGGDVSKLMNKQVSDQVARNVLNKITDGLKRIGDIPVLGSALEEGFEEAAQGFIKNSVESFYDSWIAPNNAEENKGLFGTSVLGRDEWTNMLEEGVIGSVLGGLGGFANTRRKEDTSIIPFIANGDAETVKAGAALAKQRGAITDELYNGIIERVNVLDKLRSTNKAVFADVMSVSPQELLEYGKQAMLMLRDQHEYAASTPNLSTADAALNDNKEYRSIVSSSLNTTNSLSGLRAFAQLLEDNGKREQARAIRRRIQDSERDANRLFKDRKSSNPVQRLANTMAKNGYAKQVYELREEIDSMDTVASLLNRKLQELLSSDLNLTQISTAIAQMPSITLSNSRIEALMQNYQKADTDENRLKIRNQIVGELAKQDKAIRANKSISQLTGSDSVIKVLDQIKQSSLLKRLSQVDLNVITSSDYKESFNEVITEIQNSIKDSEEVREGKKEAKNEAAKKKEEESKAPTNDAMEQAYSEYRNRLSSEQEPSTERRKYIDDVVNGDETTQVNALESELASIVKQLNDMPAEQRRGQEGDVLKSEMNQLRRLISYLRTKYGITKTEADKNKRFKSGLGADEKVYHDADGNSYIIDNPSTEYSENDGLIYRIARIENGQSREDATYQEYTENALGDFLHSLIDENGEVFGVKMNQDKKLISLNARKMKKDIQINFEPVSEGEVGGKDTQKEVTTKANAYKNKLKCIPIGDAFKERLADPRTDLSKFTGTAVAYIWDKAPKEAVEAKRKFDRYKADGKKWSDLTQTEKDELLDYLPIQLELQHPYIKNKDRKLYTNTVAIPARKSATAQVYKMDEDLVQQRSNLIAALLNQGQFIIKEGDIQIQPGYFNTVTSTAPTTLVDEYGNEVQIADETHNGDLRDIESLGIVEENGIYYITSGNQRQPLNIGIASDTENIYFTMDIDGELITRNADGTGSPGTPYLILPGFLNIGNKSANYPLKLNPRRIDRATATTVARLMQALAKGYADKSVILESSIMALPDVFGIKTQDRDLTVADVLEDIIYWGRRTLQNDPDPAYNKKYLLNKQLYIDFRRGQVRYGDKETILGDTEQDMSKFINWIMNNKSFSIDRAKIFKRAKMQYTYSIEGGYSSVAGRPYISHLLDNRIVTTNLKPKGSLYRGQFIRLKSITTTAPTNPVQQPRPVIPATKDETLATQSTELGVTKMVRKGNTYNGAIAVKLAIRVAPKGTVMQVKLQGDSIDIVDENRNKLGTLNDIQFNVEDGKINGKPVNLDVTILRPGGVGSVIASIIKEKFPNSAIDAGSVVELTIVPPTQPVTPTNIPKTPAVEGNSRVDEVFKSTTEKLLLKFKTKPSKADIDGFLNSLVNKTTNIAKLYGFKDYAEARALLQAVGSNGKTLEQNLIEFMNNIGSQPPASGPSRLEQITASVFKIPEKFTRGVTRLATALSTSRISDKEKRRLHKILGRRANAIEWVDDFINVLDYVGNPAKAYGVTTRTATRIYTGAASGTGFHEAFHNVSLFALTIELRELMYADARRIYSLQGKTNQEVEEFLANKFMEFALEMQENNRVTATNYKGLTGFFKRMWDWVLRQIGFRPSYQDINTLFRRIYDGQYSRVRTDKDSLVYFDNVYGKDAKVPLTINGVTLTMDSRTLDKLVSNLTGQLLYDNDITSLESVRKGIDMSAMKGVLQGLLESYSSIVSTSEDFNEIEQASKLVNIYRELVDNWDSVFRPLIENKLASYGIKRKQEDNTFTIDEDLNNLINDEVVSAWEINSKHNAKAEIRMLFLALPKTAQRDGATGLILYENPDVVWYNVLSNVHNCTTFDDMMDRLLKLASDTNTITGIQDDINPYNTLYQILSNGDMTLQTLFFVTMKKHRNYFVNFTFEEDGNGLDINVSDADINKRSKQINTYWSKLFSLSNLSSAERKAELSSLQDKYLEISKAVESSDTTFEQDLRSVIELLTGINIIVDEATITNIINLPTYKSDSNKKSLSNFVQSNSFINVFNKKGKTLLNKVMGDRISVDQLASALSRESLSKTLAESYVRMNPSSEDDSVLGPEGNLVYSYSEHNSITQMFTEWLKDEDYVKQMLSDPYSGNSLWLNQLLDPNVRRKIGVKTMLALMNKDNYANSRGYLSISDKEDLIIKFLAVMSGYMPLPTLANKKSYYFVSGLDNPQVKLVRDSEGNFLVSDRIVDVFAGYAQDEINAIKEAEYQISTFLIDEGLTIDSFNELSGDEQLQLIRNQGFVENYHYTNKGGKIVFNGNALKFRYFRELQNRLEKSDRRHFGDAILQVEEYTHTDEFRQDIRRYLNENINNTISLFIRNGIINTTPIRKSTTDPKALRNNNSIAVQAIEGKSYNYLPMIEVKGKKVMLNTNSSIAQAIAQYAVNTAISTLEFEKILSGDLAFYKSKSIRDALDDRTKRFSALTSTRQAMNNAVESTDDIEIDFDTRHYNSAILATNKLQLKDTYDMLYEKYIGTLEQPGLLFNRFIDFAEREVEGYSGKSREELYELAKQDAERRLSGYLSNDPTDAQVWITPMMFRKLAIMNGEWSSAKENAYNLLMSGESLTPDQEAEAYSLVMQPLKYVHYGFRITPYGVKVPTYDKMSLSTLFPLVIRGTRLLPLYDEMVDKEVDMVKMDSAVKSGNTPKTTYLDSEGNVKENFLAEINELDFRYIGKQLVTDPHEIEKTTLLTQFVKIAVSNLEPDGDYILDGRTVKGSEIRQQYNDAIVNLSNRGVERLKEKFGYKDGKVDKRKLIELLHKAGLQTNVPQNLLDALKYSEADGDYYIELSALPSLNWILSRLVSMFGKEAIDIEIPGNAFYQTTSFGIDSTNAYRKLVGDNTTRRYSDKLRFRNENGRMEVKLSINLFRGAIPSRYKTFEEQRAYILANKELFGFAYRVPTQGMNSTLPIEIVDVLPSTSGDVIFLPLEITTLTGSDFDIDKMYLARYNYYDDNGTLKKVEFIDENDYDSKEEFLEAIWYDRYGYTKSSIYLQDRAKVFGVIDYVAKKVGQNGALNLEDKIDLVNLASDFSKYISRNRILQILSDNNDSFDIVNLIRSYFERRMPLAKDVVPVTKFIENNRNKTMWELNSEEAVLNRLLDIFSSTLTSDLHFIDATTPLDVTTAPLHEIADKMEKYFESDAAISDLSPLFPAYQEDMKAKNTGADNGIGPMALINVFRTFLQMADIHIVDTPDNSIVQELGIDNLNKVYDHNGLSILDWTSALINAHVDAAKDPYIMRLNVNRFTYNMTAFMTAAGFGDVTFYFLPQPILKDLATAYMQQTGSEIGVEAWERYSKKYLDDTYSLYEDAIEGENTRVPRSEVINNMYNKEWLEKQIATPVDKRDNHWYATLLTILDIYCELSLYADAIRDAINAVQIDTKKFGTNAMELTQFDHLTLKVLNGNFIANPDDLFSKTFLRQKYNNSIRLLFDMLSGELLDFSPGFINIVEEVERITKTYYKRNVTTPNLIANEIKSSIFGKFFNQYLTENNMSVKSLFFGENSIVNRVSRLQKQIAEGQYRELADNEFLKMLLPSNLNNDSSPMMFENSITKLRDTDSKNAYTFAWMDLLEHEDEAIRELGNDLIVYAYYLGGGMSSGIYNFYDLAPYGYLANLSLANGTTFLQYVKEVVMDMNIQSEVQGKYDYVLDDVFRSAWRDDDLVPVFKTTNTRVPARVQSDKNGIKYVRLDPKTTRFMTSGDVYRPYIKLEHKGNPNDTLIFKIVGEFYNPNTGETSLVYGRVNKLGYSMSGFRIKEQGNTQLPSNEGTEYTNPSADDFNRSFIGDGNQFIPIMPYSPNMNEVNLNETITPEGDVEVTEPIIGQDVMTQEQFDATIELELEELDKAGKKRKDECK